MSLSSESLALRRKRTATERAENNGDPLAASKKARMAAKSKAAPANSGNNVSSYFLLFKTYSHTYYPANECPPSFLSPHGRD